MPRIWPLVTDLYLVEIFGKGSGHETKCGRAFIHYHMITPSHHASVGHHLSADVCTSDHNLA